MKRRSKIIITVVVFVLNLLLVGFLLWQENAKAPVTEEVVEETTEVAQDYKNATYMIDGDAVTLVDGFAETEIIPDSVTRTITRYFGNELLTDLDGDGDKDVAFILTQDGGGSGTFFYAVAALKTAEGYVGSDGYYLGDRIAPQSTNISQNPRQKYVVVFNYAEHGPDQGMSEQPSVGKSVYLKIVPETKTWAIVEPDFEGESTI